MRKKWNETTMKIDEWGEKYNSRLLIFNSIIVFLFLLRSAGYFHPFFVISVNFIVFFGLVLSIFILKATSRALFFVTAIFWTFAGVLRLLGIDVWAERTSIYVYESLILAVLVMIRENI